MPPPKAARKEGERKSPTKKQKPRQDSPRPVMEERRVYRVPSPPPHSMRGERRYGNQERRYTPYPPRMYAQNQWGRNRRYENDREGHLNRKFNIKAPRIQRRR